MKLEHCSGDLQRLVYQGRQSLLNNRRSEHKCFFDELVLEQRREHELYDLLDTSPDEVVSGESLLELRHEPYVRYNPQTFPIFHTVVYPSPYITHQ